MQYSILNNSRHELQQDYSSIGEAIEDLLESKGFYVELPTNADWGYAFRLRTNTFPVDISFVDLPDDLFGVAVEVAKGVLGFQVAKKSAEAIEYGKEALSQVADEFSYLRDLKWYSDTEWRAKFGVGFWEPRD